MSLFSACHLLQNARRSLPSYVANLCITRQTRSLTTAQSSQKTGRTQSEKVPEPNTPEGRWRRKSIEFSSNARLTPHNAYSGRSVAVIDGDVSSASKTLERFLAQNNVIREWRMSFRHRQKGEERRKLKSVRWRRRFKFEVSKKVELVQQIRRRGS